MEIFLYITTDEQNRVSKTLTGETKFTGSLRDECSILTPEFLVNAGVSATNFNYAYIPDFKRYYFIKDIVGVRNNLIRISLEVDPLMSFRDSLLKCTAIIARQQNVFNWYLPDPMQHAKANEIVTTQLPDGADGNLFAFTGLGRPEYVLIVSGGDK